MKIKIKTLKTYKEILILCKKIQTINELDKEVENKIPTFGWDNKFKKREKQRILTLY